MMYAFLRKSIKLNDVFVSTFRVILLSKFTFIFLPNIYSNTTLEIRIAENIEAKIPIINVVANP